MKKVHTGNKIKIKHLVITTVQFMNWVDHHEQIFTPEMSVEIDMHENVLLNNRIFDIQITVCVTIDTGMVYQPEEYSIGITLLYQC